MSRARCNIHWLAVAVAVVPALAATAQEKKGDGPKDAPEVKLVSPLVIARGKPASVRLRGMKLAEATEVRVEGIDGASAKVKSKGKADLPNKVEAKEAGDTQVEVELTVPPESTAESVQLVLVTPQGASKPHAVRLADEKALVIEKEPNGGFKQQQPVLDGPGAVRVQGSIQDPNDVDVYRVTAKAGQRLSAEVFARRCGSVLDPVVVVYDSRAQVVALKDDITPEERDPYIGVELPHDGVYYVMVADVHERGGATHPYELVLKLE
jgi:hypothetical protein